MHIAGSKVIELLDLASQFGTVGCRCADTVCNGLNEAAQDVVLRSRFKEYSFEAQEAVRERQSEVRQNRRTQEESGGLAQLLRAIFRGSHKAGEVSSVAL